MNKTVLDIFNYLKTLFGENPQTELNYSSDLELLVAIILSAQCTDKRVNLTTKTLFQKYITLQDYLNLSEHDLRSINFFRNKTRHIRAMAHIVLTVFNGQIPKTMPELLTLPGVGRKTASVYLAEFHKIPALAIDTHVARVARRLGFTTSKNPHQIERDLAIILPKHDWINWHTYMVLFGRYHCTARTKTCTWDPETKTIKIT